MSEEHTYVKNLLAEFDHLPRFADGRIDFSGANRVPVITCFVEAEGRVLLLRRSEQVRTYRGKWCTVAGYLDEAKTVRDKSLAELEEELQVSPDTVQDFRAGAVYEFEDMESHRTWIVHPVMVRLIKQPRIALDREHTEFKWIESSAIGAYDTVPMLERSLEAVLTEVD